MAAYRQKSLILAVFLLPVFLLTPEIVSGYPAVDDAWAQARKPRWTEKERVRGDASHLVVRNTSRKDTLTPSDAEVVSVTTPGKVYDWSPLWHNDGLGGVRIIAHGVFNDLSGSWFAERIGEVPGPYSTLFVTGNNYTGEITGGRLLKERLAAFAVWDAANAGWFTVTLPQTPDSEQEVLFVPFNDEHPIRSISFAGSTVTGMASLPDGSLWIADTDGRIWHTIDIFRGWALEIIDTLPATGILLAPSASGRHMFAAAGGELIIYDKTGKEYSEYKGISESTEFIFPASASSAVLIDKQGNLEIYSSGTLRKLDEYARTAVWLPESESYLIALRRKDQLQQLDKEGNFLDITGRSKPGVPEFLHALPNGEALLFTVTGKFSRLEFTKRNIRFSPVFNSSK
jgi:hypothetical protein